MGDPRQVRPDEVEILVTRELRKAGLEVMGLRRSSAPAPGPEYTLWLAGTVVRSDQSTALAVEFRNQSTPVSLDEISEFAKRPHEDRDPDTPKRLMPTEAPTAASPPARVMVSTSSYTPDAVQAATALGITLLAIADGPAAFRRSQWSMGEQTPAWVPEYMAERVDVGPDGNVRRTLLVATSASARRR